MCSLELVLASAKLGSIKGMLFCSCLFSFKHIYFHSPHFNLCLRQGYVFARYLVSLAIRLSAGYLNILSTDVHEICWTVGYLGMERGIWFWRYALGIFAEGCCVLNCSRERFRFQILRAGSRCQLNFEMYICVWLSILGDLCCLAISLLCSHWGHISTWLGNKMHISVVDNGGHQPLSTDTTKLSLEGSQCDMCSDFFPALGWSQAMEVCWILALSVLHYRENMKLKLTL